MGKRRTKQQRSGTGGENHFRLWADNHGLIVNKVEQDFGFDFVCQIESTSIGTGNVLGDWVMVAVRSTTPKKSRIRLTRSDADSLVTSNVVACVVLVLIDGEDANLHYRLVDTPFANELLDFLASERETTSVTPAQCKPIKTLPFDVGAALAAKLPTSIRMLAARRSAEVDLPGIRIHVLQGEDGEVALVRVPNALDIFSDATIQDRGPRHRAIFGAPHLRADRLRALGPKPAVLDHLGVWTNALIVGDESESEVVEVVDGSLGQAAARFRVVQTNHHTGWVYEHGFTFTVSRPRREGADMVHDLEAFADTDVDLFLPDHPDLWQFLECCTDDAEIYSELTPDRRLGVQWIADIEPFHVFARYLRDATQLAGWDAFDVPLRAATSEEALQTLALISELALRPEAFDGFGYYVGADDEGWFPPESEKARAEIPIIGNLGDEQAAVIWLSAEATLLIADRLVRGFRIDKTLSVRVEPHEAVGKDSILPEMVGDPTWPTVVVLGRPYMTKRTAIGWGVEIRHPHGDADVGDDRVFSGDE